MKFLSKKANSKILSENLIYKKSNSKQNQKIKEYLIEEQCNFCAYTEKHIEPLDSVEVEHFESSLKYNDNYFNYYATLRRPNLYKKDEKYVGSKFFTTKFYQNYDELTRRVTYIKGEYVFEEVDPNDSEASDFIKFLDLNNHDLFESRQKHCKRLKNIFMLAGFTKKEMISYFSTHKNELSFITALEIELTLDLSTFYDSNESAIK